MNFFLHALLWAAVRDDFYVTPLRSLVLDKKEVQERLSERKPNPRSISSISSHGAALRGHEDVDSGRCCSPLAGGIPQVGGGALLALLCNSPSGPFPVHFRLFSEFNTGISLVCCSFSLYSNASRFLLCKRNSFAS
jgi:hypothetical protein